MTDSSVPTAKPSLGVTSILAEAFSLYFRNFVPMSLVALIPVGAGVLMNLLLFGIDEQAMLGSDPDALGDFYSGVAFELAAGGILGLVLWGFAVAAITRLAYDAKVGNPVTVAGGVKAAMSNIVPVVICMLISAIAITFGFALLLLPGLFLAALWFVIIPAIVVERTGFGCFGRSVRLTKEYRWPLVGLIILFGLLLFVVSLAFGAIAGILAFGVGTGSITGFLVTQTIVNAIVSVFIYGVSGSLPALAYARLIEVKEGTTFEGLANVFS